ncbi:hypothetical protein [Trinickia sp.]|uniref:hypothetical protein n=1 Tax=Trinickia sp. TaxID=2571163 RepID=UPI003F81C39A
MDGRNLVGGDCTIGDFSVSAGQDPDHHIYKGLCTGIEVPDGVMNFSVGRHKTSSVGQWFKAQVTAQQNTMDRYDDMLNFAFIGQLKIRLRGMDSPENTMSFVFDDIVLAQTSSGASNIWIFGGKRCVYQGDHVVSCPGVTGSDGAQAGRPVQLFVTWMSSDRFALQIQQTAAT